MEMVTKTSAVQFHNESSFKMFFFRNLKIGAIHQGVVFALYLNNAWFQTVSQTDKSRRGRRSLIICLGLELVIPVLW